MRTLDKVKYTKGNKDLQSVNSEQDIELKVDNGLKYSTDGTNWNSTGEAHEIENIDLDTVADGVYILTDDMPSITYNETLISGSVYKMAIVQKAFRSGLGSFARVYKTDGTIDEFTKSNIAGAIWVLRQYDANALLPSGGTAGQVLTKVDGTDYNTSWQNASGGKLYQHVISCKNRNDSSAWVLVVYITTNSNTAFTIETLKTFLSDNYSGYYKGYPNIYQAGSGFRITTHLTISSDELKENYTLCTFTINGSTNTITSSVSIGSATVTNLTDTVTEI